MIRLIALALALAACASPPTTYERGTLRPLPSRPQPKVGPTYDPHVAPLPPQPQPPPVRVLPQTPDTRREPGIWAAVEGSGDGKPYVCGVEIPMSPLDPYEDLLTQVAPMVKCSQSLVRRIDILGLKERIEAIPMPARTCLIAALYHFCNQREMGKEGKEQIAKGSGAAALSPHLVRNVQLAENFYIKACASDRSPEGDAIEDLLKRRWDVIETHKG